MLLVVKHFNTTLEQGAPSVEESENEAGEQAHHPSTAPLVVLNATPPPALFQTGEGGSGSWVWGWFPEASPTASPSPGPKLINEALI